MKDRTRSIVGTSAAAFAAGALTLGVVVPATAQDGTDADTDTSEVQTDPAARHATRQAAFAEALADELGLDVATVTDALDAVRAELAPEHRAEMREHQGGMPEHRAEMREHQGGMPEHRAEMREHQGGMPGVAGRHGHEHGPGAPRDDDGTTGAT